MNILVFGSDRSVLSKDSALAKRLCSYAEITDSYLVIVPDAHDNHVILADGVEAYGVGGRNKLMQLYHMYMLGKTLLRNNSIDVISTQDPFYFGWIGWLLARKFKKGLEIQVHGWEGYSGLRKIIARFVLPRADSVRTVSRRSRARLITDLRLRADRILVVPIYTEKRNHLKKRKSSDAFTFLTVSRLVPVKNITLQLHALARVVGHYPDTRLNIVGDGPERAALELLVGQLELESHVTFFGNKTREELDTFYAAADSFILTSASEGWGLVVVEAAQHKLPIIMTDVGCAGECIVNGSSGTVIPIGDVDALTRAMIELREFPAKAIALGVGAHKAVEQLPTQEQSHALYVLSWEKARAFNHIRNA